jgi:uncharacterized protein (DUF1499 family)
MGACVDWPKVLLVVGLVVLGGIVVLALLSLLARKPASLGVTDGKLAPCPASPNCVSTQAADPGHHIDPIAFEGSAADAHARLKTILAAQPRCRVVTDDGTYLHAEFTSLLFRFVDDVEFLIDGPAHLIHFRSASRAGHSDLGVNRARMERIRQAFGQPGAP